jgi:colanic acid/amylovoran biosynthesis glycosyltransferase
MKILYFLGAFPKLSETFILNEITELIDLKNQITIISGHKPKEKKIHDKVKKYDLINKTRYLNFYPFSKTQKYSRLKIFEEGTKELFKNKILTQEQKLKLLKLCYNNKIGREITFKRFLCCLETIKIIKENNIEHIHCHFASENVNIINIINQIQTISYTFTTHAYDIFINPDKNIKKWADNAKKVITISEYNKRYMIDNFGIDKNKIEVIHCGIELDKFSPIKYNNKGTFKILSIARLTEKKGIRYLIEACKILKDKNISFKCNILGDGILKDELQKLIEKLNLNGIVILKGRVTQDEVLKEFENCNVFVLPCVEAANGDKDGIPVSLMEAMAREIPVISTDVTGNPELIENDISGLIVSQKDAKSLAESIIKIKNDNNLAEKIRKKGREKVMKEFNIEKNVKRLKEVFKDA